MSSTNLFPRLISVASVVLLLSAAWAGPCAKRAGAREVSEGGVMGGIQLQGRVRAPELAGGRGWLNTDKPLSLAALRGKVVLLDFWTYGCVNCMHVIPDLKKLEAKYANQLVVVGVHSAKFENEKETENIRRIILRYELEHPVVNDADFRIWQAYAVRAWPTQVLIDPAGYVVGKAVGEGNYETLDKEITRLVAESRQRGELNEQPLKLTLERAKVGDLPLAFPGKVLADARGDRLFIADSNHNRVVVTRLDGTLVATIGTGERGASDGAFDRATFHRPQGLALDQGGDAKDDVLYVADTENHLIRRVDLKARTVTTVAGTGQQSRAHPGDDGAAATPARATALNSPWDLQLVGRRLYIAMAGPHQVWRLNLNTNTVSVFAGSGREARQDGARRAAAFAQPSGLTTDGSVLYVADAESNIVRAVSLARGATGQPGDDGEPVTPDDGEGNAVVAQPKGEMPPPGEDEAKAAAIIRPTPPPEPEVTTLAGGDLFEFGDADGAGDAVRLQHPLGVLYVEGAGLFVADTYNHKIKLLDPATRAVKTVAGTGEPGQADGDKPSFYEPGGLGVANGKLYVADTNNHAIRVVDPATGKTSTLALRGLQPPQTKAAASEATDDSVVAVATLSQEIAVPAQKLALAATGGALKISVELPAGYHLNEAAPQRLQVSVVRGAPSLSLAGEQTFRSGGKDVKLPLSVPLRASAEGPAELRAQLTAYYCREDNTGTCRVKTLVWKIPVQVSADASAPREIILRATISD
ncbi:MAG TPA: thioredoxin-like domain-containing protein [Pyrinomonadaceae bacterium]|nr:thioredoxin-like domain-containing protein [Pyrinomonadaceae bacterium]